MRRAVAGVRCGSHDEAAVLLPHLNQIVALFSLPCFISIAVGTRCNFREMITSCYFNVTKRLCCAGMCCVCNHHTPADACMHKLLQALRRMHLAPPPPPQAGGFSGGRFLKKIIDNPPPGEGCGMQGRSCGGGGGRSALKFLHSLCLHVSELH
jgi:hypothetical protein